MGIDRHRLAELRSLAYHEVIARRIVTDEELVERALARLARWERSGALHPTHADRWRALLARPTPEIAESLVRDDEPHRDLRQNSPFAGEIDPAERLRIWDDVRREMETASE